ncbi:MAG: hypothetical protein H6Q33_2658 [Deltaproteobacteria bacterium]|nr:hypothetical protein [Deltaproteobacteria bacterium]
MSTPRAGEGAAEMIDLANDAPEAIFDLFEQRGWGDGLPLVPPTSERVTLMLGGAEPDEILGVIPPRFGVATRRAVAINAVLAGCRPAWLPVLTTAVRALCRDEVNLAGVQATTHPVAPLVIVHGEAVDALGFNAGCGTFGPGTRANATVGRALRLVLLHVGGARPGCGDQSTQGQPSKYSFCIAENAAHSPWEAYHRSRGLDAPSAVTVACCENPHNFHDMESARADRILLKAASALASLGSNNACISQGEIFVALCPEHAATIAADGWSRADVQSFLYERARLPRRVFLEAFDRRRWAPWMQADASDDALLPMTERADNYRVLVTGGPGKHSCVLPSWGMTRSCTLPLSP